MNRIEKAFRVLKDEGRKAFVPYIMAGDGGLECLIDRLALLEEFGATAIEVGVPFSDPVADGPTIQLAGIRALEKGTTLRGIIKELAGAKERIQVPILLMTYLNPIYAYGIEKFVHDIHNAGVAGCIIPDLPVDEEELIAPLLADAEVELIRLVTPTTPLERVKQIAGKGRGFLYTVTVKGITGARSKFADDLQAFLRRVKEVSPIPVLAGFGISNEAQIREITQNCDGVVVGSKIVDLFASEELEEMEQLISVFKEKTNKI